MGFLEQQDDHECPICRKEFRSDDCPHSFWEVCEYQRKMKQKRELEGFIRQIVREELEKWQGQR